MFRSIASRHARLVATIACVGALGGTGIAQASVYGAEHVNDYHSGQGAQPTYTGTQVVPAPNGPRVGGGVYPGPKAP